MNAYCCDSMRYHATYRCAQHPDPFACPDNLIMHDPESGDFGLIIHDGGSSYIRISFCPWCGKSLTKSLDNKKPQGSS
jgi:hypothetical protein